MKKLSMEQWEDKYTRGEVTRVDQKNTMSYRPGWDPQINGLIDDWSLNGPPEDKAGFTLEDRALLSGSGTGTMLGLFNTDLPNPRSEAVSLSHTGPFSFQPPEGMKIDNSNTHEMTGKCPVSPAL